MKVGFVQIKKKLYEESIVVLTEIIAILLTPGIFSSVSYDIGLIVSKLAYFLSSIRPPEKSSFCH